MRAAVPHGGVGSVVTREEKFQTPWVLFIYSSIYLDTQLRPSPHPTDIDTRSMDGGPTVSQTVFIHEASMLPQSHGFHPFSSREFSDMKSERTQLELTAHACNPTRGRLRQEDHSVNQGQSGILRLSLKQGVGGGDIALTNKHV